MTTIISQFWKMRNITIAITLDAAADAIKRKRGGSLDDIKLSLLNGNTIETAECRYRKEEKKGHR